MNGAHLPLLFVVVDKDGQFARGVEERPDRCYVATATTAEIADRDAATWNLERPSHAPHVVRGLTWSAP